MITGLLGPEDDLGRKCIAVSPPGDVLAIYRTGSRDCFIVALGRVIASRAAGNQKVDRARPPSPVCRWVERTVRVHVP